MDAERTVLAFDVYGTLIDTDGVLQILRSAIGEKAAAVMNIWRSKQLEYTFRRGLMRKYVDFGVCTKQALDFACRAADIELTEPQIDSLMRTYDTLPAYADAVNGLKAIADRPEIAKFAFSNGRKADVEQVLQNSGLLGFFEGVVSVEGAESFKPDPLVYGHLLSETGAVAGNAWLISGNSFDVIGAKAFGMMAIWLRRSMANIFDSWDFQPDAVVASMEEIPSILAAFNSGDAETSTAKSGK